MNPLSTSPVPDTKDQSSETVREDGSDVVTSSSQTDSKPIEGECMKSEYGDLIVPDTIPIEVSELVGGPMQDSALISHIESKLANCSYYCAGSVGGQSAQMLIDEGEQISLINPYW